MTKVLKITGLALAILFEWLLIVVIVFIFAIRSSWMQTYLANQATAYLSSELHAKVEIGAVDIVLFRFVDLKNVYIEDQAQQPILKLKHLFLGLDKFKLLQNKLLINELRMYGGKAAISHGLKEGQYNFTFLADYFSSDSQGQSSTNFQVQLANLSLEHIDFSYHDLRKDTATFGVDFDHIELKELQLNAKQISTNGSDFKCQIRNLSFIERSGFKLEQLAAEAHFSEKGLVLRKAKYRPQNLKLICQKWLCEPIQVTILTILMTVLFLMLTWRQAKFT
jgi:hypothetical protein